MYQGTSLQVPSGLRLVLLENRTFRHASIVETHHYFGASRHVRADEAHPREQISPIPLRRGTGSRQLGLSAGDVLGCPSTVAGDAGVANSGVARRARPVEDIGFAGLAVAGHSDKSGFNCAVLSAGGHWLLHVSGKVGQGCWQDTSTFVNVGEVRQGLLGRRLGQSGEGALVGG